MLAVANGLSVRATDGYRGTARATSTAAYPIENT